MSTRLQAYASAASYPAGDPKGREHPFHRSATRVASGGHGVRCDAPSDDRSALLVDIYEATDALFVMATAPGALAEDVQIEAAGSLVRITVKQRPGAKPPGCSTVRRERYAGSLTRDIELPFAIDARPIDAGPIDAEPEAGAISTAISTTLECGVLTVRIAKPTR